MKANDLYYAIIRCDFNSEHGRTVAEGIAKRASRRERYVAFCVARKELQMFTDRLSERETRYRYNARNIMATIRKVNTAERAASAAA